MARDSRGGVEWYALPLMAAAVIGALIGGLIGIGAVAGLLIGAFLVDAFRDLRGTRRVAEELRALAHELSLLFGRIRRPDGKPAAGGGETRDQHA